jgi:hypothetical protein
MNYHTLIINLVQPLVEAPLNEIESATFARALGQTSLKVIELANVHLETLFRIYYLRHGFGAMDAYLFHSLTTLGFIALRRLNEARSLKLPTKEDRCLALMCALGLRDQARYYFLVHTIYHLFCSSMSRDDAGLLSQYGQGQMPDLRPLHDNSKDTVSQYPLDVLSVSDDPNKNRVTYLLEAASATNNI